MYAPSLHVFLVMHKVSYRAITENKEVPKVGLEVTT